MIIYKYLNNYFIYTDKLKVLTDIEEVKLIMSKSDYIFLNFNLDYKPENQYSINIFYWLLCSIVRTNNLYLKADYNDIITKLENIKKDILSNKHLIKQTGEFTYYNYCINNLFNFKINTEYYESLKHKADYVKSLNNKLGTVNKSFDWYDTVKEGITYDFTNATSRIYPRGFKLFGFDDQYIGLFKYKKGLYYKLDFVSFYPKFLYFYTNNKLYYDPDFYIKEAAKFGMERKEFKQSFNAFLNGSYLKDYPGLYNNFCKEYSGINTLKESLTSNCIINMYNRKFYCREDYQRLGYLISNTAEDCLKLIFKNLYEKYKFSTVDFIWLKYDELFVRVDYQEQIKLLENDIKIYDFLEVKEELV
jgi:hypothetical protein